MSDNTSMRTAYFGVLTNREYLKLGGVKYPFFDFLEKQPSGWLTSLTYAATEKTVPLPDSRGRMIWDCGAWSYREEFTPVLAGKPVTPETALERYLVRSRVGDFIVAPDHMLVDGVDIDARRAWNADSARCFIRLNTHGRIPVGVVHGQTIDERLQSARFLTSLGYEVLALGGIAARASQRTLALDTVRAVREATKGRWLHVLGLSSPRYLKAWSDMGVDSCDGSSHFKQAFAGGAYFTQRGAELKKHKAVQKGEKVTAPDCDCFVCSTLLEKWGIDTRSFGSNETNMGRAIHNMTMLMRAHDAIHARTTVLVACCGAKHWGATQAADLYLSPLFKKSRAWAEKNGNGWAILSAKHGLVHPDQIIHAYEKTLNDMSAAEVDAWGNMVAGQIARSPMSGDRFVVLAGSRYLSFTKHGRFHVENPLEGLGIGERLAWLDGQNSPQLKLIKDDE